MKILTEELKFPTDRKLDLKDSYEQSLKNEAFYELVSQLNFPKQKLIYYTSRLEDCSKEYEHCKNCKGILECKNEVRGYAYLPHIQEEKLFFEYQACRYRNNLIKSTKYLNNVASFQIPKELLKASMEQIDIKDKNRYPAIKWIQKFLTSYEKDKPKKGLYLHGSFGAGKSYLISAMFCELAHKNVKSAIVFWPEFLRDLKASFTTDFKEKYEYVKTVPLLLIDDIGAESTTEWGRDEIFCPLIQYRMEESLPTFFTSNLDLKLLEEHFSISRKGIDVVKARRIISRIEQLTDQIEMVSYNRRS